MATEAPAYPPNPGSQPPVPVIRTAPPTCDPLNEMMGLARHGRERASDPQYRSAPTRLAMTYYGAEACSARALPKEESFAVSCLFPEADQETTQRVAGLITATVAACRPKWTRQTLAEGALFDNGEGATFLVEARSEKPLGLVMTFERPKAK
jgi:hypothetical protein